VTGRWLTCLLAVLISPALLCAQRNFTGVPPRNTLVQPTQPLPGPPGLSRLARFAGTIFSGTVTSVGPVSGLSPGEIPAVAITFRVEHAIRGANPGHVLVIREWGGLWGDGPRYLPGQRLLLFLFSPSRLGLTSTVAGTLGRFKIDSAGDVLLNAQQAALIGQPAVKRLPLQVFVRALASFPDRERP